MGEEQSQPRDPYGVIEEHVLARWEKYIPKEERPSFHTDVRRLGVQRNREMQTLTDVMTRLEAERGRDEVTSLPRRKFFNQNLNAVLVSAANGHGPEAIGIVFADMVGFKEINDRYGHQKGDKALSVVASILREALRTEDGEDRPGDVIYRPNPKVEGLDPHLVRYGGDEFLILVRLRKVSDVKQVALRIRCQVNDYQNQKKHGHTLETPLKASFGAVGYGLQPDRVKSSVGKLVSQLVGFADKLMYRSKRDKTGSLHYLLLDYQDCVLVREKSKLP